MCINSPLYAVEYVHLMICTLLMLHACSRADYTILRKNVQTQLCPIRELSVSLDGQRFKHKCHQIYFGVTLDRTLSHREHLTIGNLKNRNKLLMKLTGSTWGASANTLRSSALTLCYSAAEYCAPVWSRSAHINLPGRVELHHASHFWHPFSIPLQWLPVLSNIEPPALRRKAATDKLVEKIVKHDSWRIQPDILNSLLPRLTSTKLLWMDLQPTGIKSR